MMHWQRGIAEADAASSTNAREKKIAQCSRSHVQMPQKTNLALGRHSHTRARRAQPMNVICGRARNRRGE